MDFALISMGKTLGKYPILEHCCYSLENEINFPNEMALFYSTLLKNKKKAGFFDGNLKSEERILQELKETKQNKIVYYLYTPYIRYKKEFMEKLSKLGELHLVITPFFWKEKILREFPFVKDVHYDGEKGFKMMSFKTKIKYEDFNIEPYLKGKKNFKIIFSKYCPYQCTYCNAQRTGLMERDIENVRKEIEFFKNKGIKKFTLCGNNLTINKKKFLEICKMMKELEVEWEGDGRVDHMGEEMYNALVGTKGTLLFGVESADQEILDKIKKGINLNNIIKNSQEFEKRKLPVRHTFMFGFPEDSKKTADKMINLRKKMNSINYQINIISAFPGTPSFEELKKEGLIDELKLDFEDFSWAKLPLSPTKYLSKSELLNQTKRIMLQGIFKKNVLRNIFRRNVVTYPLVFLKGVRILIYGKRIWKQ